MEKVCQTKQNASKERTDAHHIECSPGCLSTVKDILHLRCTRSIADKFMLGLMVNGKKLTFEVDTGSPVSLISARDKRCFFDDLDVHPKSTRLVSYCDSDINVLGKIFVNTISNGAKLTLPLHVTESNRHPLLGRDWLLELNQNFNRVFKPGVHSISYAHSFHQPTLSALKNILTKYSRVFGGDVGKIVGVQASLKLRPDSQPVYIKARPVAFSVRNAIDKEIDKLGTRYLGESRPVRVGYSCCSF